MRTLRKIISFLLAVLLGFWLASAGILNGTKAGYYIDEIVNYLPDRQDINKIIDLPTSDEPPQVKFNSPKKLDKKTRSKTTEETNEDEIDVNLIEDRILSLLNDLREEKGLNTLEPNEMLREAANIRAVETEESFSHTRPDGSETFTVFEEEGITYPYRMAGENLAMATYYLDEEEMADLLFDGWVESEEHYENMIQPDYEEIGIGVHYDGEYLYATQLFGTQR